MNALVPTLWAALGCPLCKTTLEEEGARVASGYNTSVIVMLLGLFGLVGLMVFLFVREVRSTGQRSPLSGAASSPGAVTDEGTRSRPEPSAAPPARSR